MMHEIFTTAIVHSTPYYALGMFGAAERIESPMQVIFCLAEIRHEQQYADADEIEQLNKVKRFLISAPHGKSLSRSKIRDNGEFQCIS